MRPQVSAANAALTAIATAALTCWAHRVGVSVERAEDTPTRRAGWDCREARRPPQKPGSMALVLVVVGADGLPVVLAIVLVTASDSATIRRMLASEQIAA